MTVQSKLTAIADKIRAILGSSGKMGLDNMATNLTEVNDEVIDQEELIEQIAATLEGKGINGGVNITGETCTVTFPENGLSPTIYYLDQKCRDTIFLPYLLFQLKELFQGQFA